MLVINSPNYPTRRALWVQPMSRGLGFGWLQIVWQRGPPNVNWIYVLALGPQLATGLIVPGSRAFVSVHPSIKRPLSFSFANRQSAIDNRNWFHNMISNWRQLEASTRSSCGRCTELGSGNLYGGISDFTSQIELVPHSAPWGNQNFDLCRIFMLRLCAMHLDH